MTEDRMTERIPELGNLLWGNSRGEFPISRDEWQDKFCELMDALDMDYHCYVPNDCKNQTDRGGYENDVFLINPYYWGEDEEIEKEPNFIFKPLGYELQWYKYPLRDTWANMDIAYDKFAEIIDECIDSIE